MYKILLPLLGIFCLTACEGKPNPEEEEAKWWCSFYNNCDKEDVGIYGQARGSGNQPDIGGVQGGAHDYGSYGSGGEGN